MKRRKTYAFPPKLQRRFSDASLEATSILLPVCWLHVQCGLIGMLTAPFKDYARTPSFENAKQG